MKRFYTSALACVLLIPAMAQVTLKSQSKTPALVNANKDIAGLQVFTLISSDDTLSESPNFVFGGSADGCGLLRNGSDFIYVVNHEDNFSVSRITLDNTFKPKKGEYLINSNAGQWRLCSATLATEQEHGFGPKFITCGESSEESMTHAIDPTTTAKADSASEVANLATGLGRWIAENAVPLNKNAYPGKTVVILGDDDSGVYGGQLVLYIANAVGDLNNGKLYVLRRTNVNQIERHMKVGITYDVEFAEIPNAKTLTGRQLNEKAVFDLFAMKFGRVEDIDYRRGSAVNNRQIFFNATGQAFSGGNADSSRTQYGRVYKLELNELDPTQGKLTCLLDGDDQRIENPARVLYNPDNITATKDFLYITEDPNGYDFTNKPANEQQHNHDARMYQYDLVDGSFKTVMELDHHRSAVDSARFNRKNNGGLYQYNKSGKGSWEYGATEDISDVVGVPNTFLVNIQPHTWIGDRYKGADKGSKRPSEDQASEVIIVKGLPRERAVVSINEIEADNALKVFPNPASNYASLLLHTEEHTATVEMINTLGQVVYMQNFQVNGQLSTTIDMSSFAKGTYIVKTTAGSRVSTQIINKQ